MDQIVKRNDAVRTNGYCQNGKCVDIAITEHGSDFYFAICAVMGFVGLGIVAASYTRPRTDRVFFYISAAINLTAFVAYYSMGSHLGWTPIDVEFQRSDDKVAGVNREIFYARYIDWVITTPLLLLDLLLTAGLPWQTILWATFLDEVMIVTGLLGALVKTSYKWGYYTIGCVAMFGVFWSLIGQGRLHAKHLGSDVSRVYFQCGILTLFIWTLYPIAWGLSEGGNVIPPDSEAVFYGVLDFIAKPIFSIALVWGHWNIDPARLGLKLRDYDADIAYHGNPGTSNGAAADKHFEANGTNGVTEGEAAPAPAVATQSETV
ncbi:hypothetical protein AC579_7431 [Pseudocercospora musae]|uniref:Bacteriorhodopsin n=1 Tax=Pseudocercospora musae TaxID=113226 RepID=A0A139IQC2_9PEZI|nr:hypothetical protein AC579_7431 [Pseudocercospora musae]